MKKRSVVSYLLDGLPCCWSIDVQNRNAPSIASQF
jgi:hypothetical protein